MESSLNFRKWTYFIPISLIFITCSKSENNPRGSSESKSAALKGSLLQAGIANAQEGGSSTEAKKTSLAPLVERARAPVVGVTTHTKIAVPEELREFWRRYFGTPAPFKGQEQTGLGSGVIIDPKGLVLTNYHVVADAQDVLVKTAEGKEYSAKVRGTDSATDLAVLQLKDVTEALHAATLGSSDSIKVGDYVIAIGNPFGLALTVTNGIVSAKSRVIGVGPFDEFLQTDAAINPGNSGGPLFDMEGKVIGINTAIVSTGQGIGFAVPIDLIKALLPQLEKNGKIARGYLGIAIQDSTPELAKALGSDVQNGALVASVEKSGPAAKGGVEAGDIITSMNGKAIKDATQLSRQTALSKPGDQVELGLVRKGKRQELTVVLTERPKNEGGESDKVPQEEKQQEKQQDQQEQNNGQDGAIGLMLQPVPNELKKDLGSSKGALVADVQPGTRGSKAGIKIGDVIVEANREAINSPNEFMAIASKNQKNPIALRILREGKAIYLVINP